MNVSRNSLVAQNLQFETIANSGTKPRTGGPGVAKDMEL